jgi:hypothetical protein
MKSLLLARLSSFANIKHAVDIRQMQQAEGPRLDDICCKVPVSVQESVHGIHRQCYKKFTNESKNYQSFQWKHAHILFPEVKSPEGLGWFKGTEGDLQTDWTDGYIILPQV